MINTGVEVGTNVGLLVRMVEGSSVIASKEVILNVEKPLLATKDEMFAVVKLSIKVY